MQKILKPNKVALIREAECIGCTKCIDACPFDSILGAAKQMHTVIFDECIGCELCVPACPVDCIDLITLPPLSEDTQKAKIIQVRKRYQARKKRLVTPNMESFQVDSLQARKEYIQAAINRSNAKKVLK